MELTVGEARQGIRSQFNFYDCTQFFEFMQCAFLGGADGIGKKWTPVWAVEVHTKVGVFGGQAHRKAAESGEVVYSFEEIVDATGAQGGVVQ